MIKTILVPLSGGEMDEAVFAAALDVAKTSNGHMDCFHVEISAAEAAATIPHADFLMGAAMREWVGRKAEEAREKSAAAFRQFSVLCERNEVILADLPQPAVSVTATWRDEASLALDRLVINARHSDMVVMGRPRPGDGVPHSVLSRLLVESGRPLLILPAAWQRPLLDCVMVFWKETAAAAHALAMAVPLLQCARRVVLACAEEASNPEPRTVNGVAQALQWHGVAAECVILPANNRSALDLLDEAAKEHQASLVVAGGYSRSVAREVLFGGVTQSLLANYTKPVFIVH